MWFRDNKYITLIVILFQIGFGASSGRCEGVTNSLCNSSNLSPQIIVQQNLIQDVFAQKKAADQIKNLPINQNRLYEESLRPDQDTGWIDIDEVTFPLKVVINSTQELLITFEIIEEKNFFSGEIGKKIYAVNHFDRDYRSRISDLGTLCMGWRFIKSSIEDDEFATIEIEKKGHYLKVKNSGTMDLDINFQLNRNATGKLAIVSSTQMEFIIRQLKSEYSLNPMQCNMIKENLLGNVTLWETVNSLSLSQPKNSSKNISWIRLLCALPLVAKHEINISLAEKLIQQIWDGYRDFGPYIMDEYVDDILELLLVGEMPADRFLLVEQAYENKASQVVEILRLTSDYCSGKEGKKLDTHSWEVFDFLEKVNILGYQLNYMQVEMLTKFLLRKITLEELKKDPLNTEFLGQLEKIVFPDTDINPWKKEIIRKSENQIKEIEFLAKVCFIMFEAHRHRISLKPYIVSQIAMNLTQIMEAPEALYPLSVAAIYKDKRDPYSVSKEQHRVYCHNIKNIIEDAKVLAGHRPPEVKMLNSATKLKGKALIQDNAAIIGQAI